MKTHRYIPIVILILGFLTVNPLETEAASRYLEAAMEALKPMGGVILEVGVLPSPPPSRRQIIDADKGEACLQCHHMSYPVAPQKPEKAGEKALSSIQITPPGGLRLLTSLKDPINQAAGGWSPDGKKIMFSRKMGDNWDLWVMNRDGSDPIRLTTHPAAELWPYWSPDGKWVIFSSTIRGHLDVLLMQVDASMLSPTGGLLKRLTHSEDREVGTVWSPDGKKVAFESDRMGNFDIWVVEVPQ